MAAIILCLDDIIATVWRDFDGMLLETHAGVGQSPDFHLDGQHGHGFSDSEGRITE